MAGYFPSSYKSAGGSGSMVDFSTSEVDTGVKWIDGKNIYCIVYHYGTSLSSSWVSIGLNANDYDTLISCTALNSTNYSVQANIEKDGGYLKVSSGVSVAVTDFIIYYTKP